MLISFSLSHIYVIFIAFAVKTFIIILTHNFCKLVQLFLDALYKQLTIGNATSRYPWLLPQFYADILRALLERSYDSIELNLSYPPKPHSFVSLPLQNFYKSFVLLAPRSGFDPFNASDPSIKSETLSREDTIRHHLSVVVLQRVNEEDNRTAELSEAYLESIDKLDEAVTSGSSEQIEAGVESQDAILEAYNAAAANTAEFMIIAESLYEAKGG